MLVTALRQLDDLVVYDDTTNTVRPIIRNPEQQAQKEADDALVKAAAARLAAQEVATMQDVA